MMNNIEVPVQVKVENKEVEDAWADWSLRVWLGDILPCEIVLGEVQDKSVEGRLLTDFSPEAESTFKKMWANGANTGGDDNGELVEVTLDETVQWLPPQIQYPRRVPFKVVWQALIANNSGDYREWRGYGFLYSVYYKFRDGMRAVGNIWHNLPEAYNLLNERFVYEVMEIKAKTNNNFIKGMIKFFTGV